MVVIRRGWAQGVSFGCWNAIAVTKLVGGSLEIRMRAEHWEMLQTTRSTQIQLQFTTFARATCVSAMSRGTARSENKANTATIAPSPPATRNPAPFGSDADHHTLREYIVNTGIKGGGAAGAMHAKLGRYTIASQFATGTSVASLLCRPPWCP